MHWFKWTYFHERALLHLQRCCQGHGGANAACRADQPLPAAGSGCFKLRCWVRDIVNSRAVDTSGCITRCSDREVAVLRQLIRTFLKMSMQSTLDSFDNEAFTTEREQLPAIWDSRSSSYSNKQ